MLQVVDRLRKRDLTVKTDQEHYSSSNEESCCLLFARRENYFEVRGNNATETTRDKTRWWHLPALLSDCCFGHSKNQAGGRGASSLPL